ncbi:membrane protein [Streptomyces griseoaurantiacus]|nr:membrane protein [Streptomyces griseoaurantiacus]
MGNMLLTAFGGLMWLLYTAMLVLAVVALVMAALFRDDAYRAADKKTKGFWLIILGVTVAVNLLIPMLFLQLAGLVATIVFFVDVRPALRGVSGGGFGRRSSGGSSSDGPYGPYNGGR